MKLDYFVFRLPVSRFMKDFTRLQLRLAGSFAALACFLGTAFAQPPAPASPVTLSQAVQIALEQNPLRKAAVADARAASSGIGQARSTLLPHLTFSESAARGNDPVYVFGSKLRQQRFTPNDFALNELNTPRPFGNFTTRFAGQWSLFDGFASWRSVSRARLLNQAAEHQLERTQQEIIFHVVDTYYGVLLAARQLDVAEQSSRTAQAIVELSQARVEVGVAVESDLLSAKVRLGAREQERIRARNNLEMAKAQLNGAMGVPLESLFQPAEALAERTLAVAALPELEKQALASRPDLKSIQSQESAQRESVSIAKSGYSPRVNAFGGWEMDNPTFLAGGGGNNWLGGIEVQFDLFQGGAKRAELSRQRALADRAGATRLAAADGVRLEVRRAFYEVDASRQQVEVARAAIALAQESLRINRDRYDSGLITITDLLGAEDAARRSQSDYWDTVYRFHSSYARLELASGTLSPQSAAVMP